MVPEPHVFQVDISRRNVVQVFPNGNGIRWYGTRWTDDGKYIEVYASRAQVYADILMLIDPQNARYTSDTQVIEGENILGVTNELPFTLEDRESLWAGCQKENVFFTAKYLDSKYGFWETRLWKGSQLIKTFPPIRFHFDLYQGGFNDDPVGWTIEYSHFSPDCRYDILPLGKDVWLLDTVEKSFSRIFEIRSSLHDIVQGSHAYMWPSWAPNSREFVFGDGRFGNEKYDVQSKKRSWLLGPDFAGGAIEWSKTGRWILGYFNQSMSVISPDGRNIGTLAGCENIQHPSWSPEDIHASTEDPSWSPTDDKVAFICKQYDQSSCKDGNCEKEESFLVIWDLSNLDHE